MSNKPISMKTKIFEKLSIILVIPGVTLLILAKFYDDCDIWFKERYYKWKKIPYHKQHGKFGYYLIRMDGKK